MNILVTGSNGFIGKHLCLKLNRLGYNVFSYDLDKKEEDLRNYISQADFVVHLAGINRPLTSEEFYDGNTNFTKKLVAWLTGYCASFANLSMLLVLLFLIPNAGFCM